MTKSRTQSERKRKQRTSEQEASQAQLRLTSIVESSEDAILVNDINGIIIDWNDAAARLYGYEASEIVGKPVSLLAPPDRFDEIANIMTKIQQGEIVKHFETTRLKKDGGRIDVSLTVFPIIDAGGRIVGASAIVRDIREGERTEKALRGSQELLRMAAEAGRMLAYDWDAATDEITRSEDVSEILGENEGTRASGRRVLSMIPPDDRERVMAAVAQLTPENPLLHIRHRMARSDGAVIWVDSSGHAYFDQHSKLLRIVGLLTDITDRVRGEEALFQKDRELSEAQRLAGVGSWNWDVRNDIVLWSEELYRIAGLDTKLPAPAYREQSRLFSAESWERLSRAVEKALDDGTSYALDLEMVRPDGTTRWLRARGETVRDSTGRIVRLRGTAQDVTEQKLTEALLAGMSHKLLDAQEQERERIGRELHDDINQRLALLSVQIEQTRATLPLSTEELQRRMDALLKQTAEISSSVQSWSHRLHPSKLDYLGLVPAVKGFCKEFGEEHKVKVNFDSDGIPPDLPPDVSLCLFRVVQEGLHNALKHSGVRSFEVRLHGSPTEIRLALRDSGVGFDPELARDAQGLGLLSMQERVRMVQGSISITSKPHSGTEISVRVPFFAGGTEQAKSAGA